MTKEEAHEVLEDFQRLLTNYRHISSELTEANGMAINAFEKLDELKFIVEQERKFYKNNPDFLVALQPIKMALEDDKINWRTKL